MHAFPRPKGLFTHKSVPLERHLRMVGRVTQITLTPYLTST
jgi:hypothetical protein